MSKPISPIASRTACGLVLAMLTLAISSAPALAFTVTFDWCRGAPDGSPNFALRDVPRGTVNLRFAMTDLDKPTFHHGGGTVGYRGQPEVPCDAFDTAFIGPSPPPGEVHTYEFSIQALAPDGSVLGATTARKRFPE
jgi:phosphatidylethanolamine-binding protein (PEBP) family uncharacterized protein